MVIALEPVEMEEQELKEQEAAEPVLVPMDLLQALEEPEALAIFTCGNTFNKWPRYSTRRLPLI
jgi:hypothetical protein